MLLIGSIPLLIGTVVAFTEVHDKDLSQKFKHRASTFHHDADLDGSTLGKSFGQPTRVQAFRASADNPLSRAHRALVEPRPKRDSESADGGLAAVFRKFQEERAAEPRSSSASKDLPVEEKKEGGLSWADVFGFSGDFEEGLWNFAQGRKERKWSPDRRPAAEQGVRAGPGPNSRLSWGGDISSARYDLMAKHRDLLSSRTIESPVELAELIRGKYGYYHDVSVIRNMNHIAFNIYRPYLGMRTFPYTEEQYLNKLASIIYLLKELDQAWYVKDFLLEPPTPKNGLPSTPRADTAVTVRLNLSPTWDDAQNQEIFSAWLMLRGRVP